MIKILTDSIADIPKELLIKHHIETISMYMQIGGKVYQDGRDINPKFLFESVEKNGDYPTTSAPPPTDYIKFFDRSEPSIFIGVSGKLSAAMKNAQIAVKELGKQTIDLIDSRSISIVYGQIVLQAARWRDEGLSFEELGKRIRNLVDISKGVFILDTLEYLYHGGRCSAVDHFAASLLSIRPFLHVRPDGTLGLLKKVHGSRKKSVKALLTHFIKQYMKFDINHISIGHLDCLEEAQFLRNQINELGYKHDILITDIGCVLASHSGPNPLGIAFTVSEKASTL